MSRLYMHPETGSIGEYEDWYYEDEEGETYNAVDEEEVIEVEKDNDGSWVEAIPVESCFILEEIENIPEVEEVIVYKQRDNLLDLRIDTEEDSLFVTIKFEPWNSSNTISIDGGGRYLEPHGVREAIREIKSLLGI